MLTKRSLFPLILLSTCLVLTACGDEDDPEMDGDGDGNEEPEVFTTIEMTFTPGAGDALVFEFDDADGDGGDAPQIDTVTLAADTTYELSLRFFNKLATPVEEVTPEIREEAEEHQLFIVGASVSGEATGVAVADALVSHEYDDSESDYADNTVGEDLPVGLVNTVATVNTGTDGEFRVVLRHLPPVNDVVQKTAGLEDDVIAGGIEGLPGDTDIDVTFDLVVE